MRLIPRRLHHPHRRTKVQILHERERIRRRLRLHPRHERGHIRVPDQDWNDGDPIPQDVTGAVETVSAANGDIPPVLVWHAPLTPGRYDIVIDANRNGVYNAATDGLDSGAPGFVVVASPPPTPPTDVPTLTPPGIIALVGLLCVAGMSRIIKRFN